MYLHNFIANLATVQFHCHLSPPPPPLPPLALTVGKPNLGSAQDPQPANAALPGISRILGRAKNSTAWEPLGLWCSSLGALALAFQPWSFWWQRNCAVSCPWQWNGAISLPALAPKPCSAVGNGAVQFHCQLVLLVLPLAMALCNFTVHWRSGPGAPALLVQACCFSPGAAIGNEIVQFHCQFVVGGWRLVAGGWWRWLVAGGW